MTFTERLLPAGDHESLLGDIKEEAPRRSRLWYWAQLAALVIVASWHDVRRHPKVAWIALLTGEVAIAVYYAFITSTARVMWVLQNGGYSIGGYWLTLPRGPLGSPYDVLVAFAITFLGFAFSGWTLARFFRAHGIAMVLPHMLLTSLLALIPLVIAVNDAGPGTRAMPVPAMIWTLGSMYASIPGGVLVGGILGAMSGRRASTGPVPDRA
jgi:hypothetical protein